jgi:hypothetical protein
LKASEEGEICDWMTGIDEPAMIAYIDINDTEGL